MADYCPSKFIVERNIYNSDQVLGVMIPFESQKAKDILSSKRKTSGSLKALELDNTLTTGYSLVNQSGSYYSGSDYWHLMHPLGFEVQVKSPNIFDIIQNCTISKGVIQDKLIWCRLGSVNYLTYENSPVHTRCLIQDVVAPKIKLTDIKFGNNITLSNGRTGYYLGSAHVLNNWDMSFSREYFLAHKNPKTTDAKDNTISTFNPSHTTTRVIKINSPDVIDKKTIIPYLQDNMKSIALYDRPFLIIHNKSFNRVDIDISLEDFTGIYNPPFSNVSYMNSALLLNFNHSTDYYTNISSYSVGTICAIHGYRGSFIQGDTGTYFNMIEYMSYANKIQKTSKDVTGVWCVNATLRCK